MKRSFGVLLTEYANLSFDAGRWSADPKTHRRYERVKNRADVIRERLVTLYMHAVYPENTKRKRLSARVRPQPPHEGP